MKIALRATSGHSLSSTVVIKRLRTVEIDVWYKEYCAYPHVFAASLLLSVVFVSSWCVIVNVLCICIGDICTCLCWCCACMFNKMRVCLITFVANNCNFFLLDEPQHHNMPGVKLKANTYGMCYVLFTCLPLTGLLWQFTT